MSYPPREEQPESASDAAKLTEQKGISSKDGPIGENKETFPPTITAFISNSKISPSAFLKVLKAQKVKRFSQTDEDQAAELMALNDGDGDRLWALISQASLPGAVDRWIWRAAKDRLTAVVGPEFNPMDHDAGRILRTLQKSLSPRIKSEEKQESKAGENWLRIGICWLEKKRSLQPWAIAESVWPVFFQEHEDALHTSKRALRVGRSRDFKLAISMAGLGLETVNAAKTERDTAKQAATRLRHQLEDSDATIKKLRAELASLRRELEDSSETLRSLQAQLVVERQHWGHDLSETKAEQRVLLGERVAPLLLDAIDALEIEPPAPHVALSRLKAVHSIIEGASS